MKKSVQSYNVTPAAGQALLSFQGRLFPERMVVFEAELVEKVRTTKTSSSLLDRESELNAEFTNLLMQGDCLSACAYLKSRKIKIDLVYIDPPFASGANYAKKLYLRNGSNIEVENNGGTIGEEVMYGDIWRKEDYLNWLYERLLAIREVMSDNASIYVHLDWHVGHYVKVLMDEVFGENNFANEIIWHYRRWSAPSSYFQNMHDTILFYTKSSSPKINPVYVEPTEGQKKKHAKGYDRNTAVINGKRQPQLLIYNQTKVDEAVKRGQINLKDYARIVSVNTSETIAPDVWEINYINSQSKERVGYPTQKPKALLERIISASSDEGMIVADFFSGSGTTAKVANSLNRRFVACDIGINAIQSTRDGLVSDGADFNVLKIQDGLRLFRNPAQTTARIFGLIEGFKSVEELELQSFWNGGIAHDNGTYSPVKFSGIENALTKEMLDSWLEEVYILEDTTNMACTVHFIYAHKELDVDQIYLDKTLHAAAKTELRVELISLDALLGEKRDSLFASDSADVEITKEGDQYQVKIRKFWSPYLKNKLDEYNTRITNQGTIQQDMSKALTISESGLELIEAVQFDTTLDDIWKSNPDLEDKAESNTKIKGVYFLDTDQFMLKIRNITGDEVIVKSDDIA